MKQERTLPPSSVSDKVISILSGTLRFLALVFGTEIVLDLVFFFFISQTAGNEGYLPGRDTTAYWADGQVEILRGHDFKTGKKEFLLRIGNAYMEDGTVTAYKRNGNPVQVLAENRLYTIDEQTLTYTVQTLPEEEILPNTRHFRRLFP